MLLKFLKYYNLKIVKNIKYLPDQENKNHKLWKKYHSINNGLITFAIKKKGKKLKNLLII